VHTTIHFSDLKLAQTEDNPK